jgi:hypothetical protein
LQIDSYSYLVSATLKHGDYSTKDFLTDLMWNFGFAVGGMLLSRGISKALRVAGEALSVDRGAVAEEVMQGILHNLPSDDVVSRKYVRDFGMEIANSPVATAVYSRLQEVGANVRLDFVGRPVDASGRKIVGLNTMGGMIEIFWQNAKSAKEAVEYLVHEGVHAEKDALLGSRQATKYEEYLAFRRQLLFRYGRKPTMEERREIWQFVNEAYSDLPTGQSPF